MAFASNFGRILSPTFQPNSQAKKAGGWWLAGGIDPADCVAAYQPKGAASYAASKVNLANSGTHDLSDGTAYPSWNASTGWTFTKASSQYLISDINPAAGNSTIVRVANASTSSGIIYGGFTYSSGVGMNAEYVEVTSWGATRFGKGRNSIDSSGILASGIYAIAGYKCYKNAELKGTISGVWDGGAVYPLHIGRRNGNTGIVYFGGDILAFATYSIDISSYISSLVTAMSAL